MYDPRFNELSFEKQNENDINNPQSYMKLLVGHHAIEVTWQTVQDIWNVIKDVELSKSTTLSLPIRGQVHVMTVDQLEALKARLTALGMGEAEPPPEE